MTTVLMEGGNKVNQQSDTISELQRRGFRTYDESTMEKLPILTVDLNLQEIEQSEKTTTAITKPHKQ